VIEPTAGVGPTDAALAPSRSVARSVWRGLPRVPPLSIVGVVGFLILWELSQYVRDQRPMIAYPSEVVRAFVDMTIGSRQTEYITAVVSTLQFLIFAFGIGAAFGLVAGFLVGHFWILRTTIYPYLVAIYSTPRLALLPLFVIWLGIGAPTATAVVFVAAGFTVLVGTAEGVQNARKEYLAVARSFGANEIQRIWKVVAPASAPYMITALRLGAGRAVIAALSAELFIGTGNGLGRLLDQYTTNLAMDRAFVVVATVAVLASTLMGAFGLLGGYVDRRHGRGAGATGDRSGD
jgi:ABC-type nitrate/sulfonate/bicarbonate transport system permease component